MQSLVQDLGPIPSQQSFSLIDALLQECGEHDLANRLYGAIDLRWPLSAVVDLFGILVWSTSDNGTALRETAERWLSEANCSRKLHIALHLEIFPFATRLEMETVFASVCARFPEFISLCESLVTERKKQSET